jgi:aminoglycoside phosphotransferase (APT) family kinase protein
MPLLTGGAYPWSHEHPATAGGRALDIGSIIALLETLDDLSTVSPLDLIEVGLRVSKPKKAPSSCNEYLSSLLRDGLVTKSEMECALNLVVSWASTHGFDSPTTISNGDFRFGNFLNVSEKRTAILDWDDARASSFELERCVGRLWVFLWNRPDLQQFIVRAARALPRFDRDTFRTFLLLSALRQTTRHRDEAMRSLHTDQVVKVLNDDYFSEVWG